MIFALTGAVRFHAKPAVDVACRSTPRLATQVKALTAELKRLEAKDIKKQLHVNDNLAKQYEKNLGNFAAQQPVAAASLYDSPLFNTFDAPSLAEDDASWANHYIRIFSGLYGLLRPFDEIQPVSLPVSLGTKLTTSKGKFLRDFWRPHLTKQMEDSVRGCPLPVIVNLSTEDELDIIDMEKLPTGTHVHSVQFQAIDKNEAAANMGEFLRWAMINKCMQVEDLLEFRGLVDDDEPAAFRVSSKRSKGDVIVFEANVTEGAGGSWKKNLAESGLSKHAFMKAEASGKKRYKRTEMNKALAKEDKKRRKTSAVY
jgi:cytoplasmic iron level regulating protein YaaA (DUF328/UPF0246 family)